MMEDFQVLITKLLKISTDSVENEILKYTKTNPKQFLNELDAIISFFNENATKQHFELQLEAIVQILSNFALVQSLRHDILNALQDANKCFELIFEREKGKTIFQYYMLICLIRICDHKLKAQDLLEFLNEDIESAVDLLLTVLEKKITADTNDRKIEQPLAACIATILHQLTLPSTYFKYELNSSFKLDGLKSYALQDFSEKVNILTEKIIDKKLVERLIKSDPILSILEDSNPSESTKAHQNVVNSSIIALLGNMGSFVANNDLRSKMFIHYSQCSEIEDMFQLYFKSSIAENFNNETDKQFVNAWVEFFDTESGSVYYYNPATHETAWDVPTDRFQVLETSRSLQQRIDGTKDWLRMFSMIVFNIEQLKRDLVWNTIQTIILNSHEESSCFFQEHYFALSYLLILMTNADSLNKETSCFSEFICDVCGKLNGESRTRIHSILHTYQNTAIARSNPTFEIVSGLLFAPEILSSTSTSEEPLLEENWDELYDEETKCAYFYNTTTGESCWEKPTPLPVGWIVVWCDEYKQYYFFNSTTQVATWERPTEVTQTDEPATGTKSSDAIESKQEEVAKKDTEGTYQQSELMQKWIHEAQKCLSEQNEETKVGEATSTKESTGGKFRLLGELPCLKPPSCPPSREVINNRTKHRRQKRSKKRKKKVPISTIDFLRNIPPKFLCQINKHIMSKPMKSPAGHYFEYETIKEWLSKMGSVCPITNQYLKMDDLIVDSALRLEIAEFHIKEQFCEQKSTAELDQDNIYDF